MVGKSCLPRGLRVTKGNAPGGRPEVLELEGGVFISLPQNITVSGFSSLRFLRKKHHAHVE
jgi:hypothetical protein